MTKTPVFADDESEPEQQQLQDAVGARIRALREERGWSQKDLAARCDLKAPYVYEIERGAANVTLRTLLRLANAFGVTPRDLMVTTSNLEAENQTLRDMLTRILGKMRTIYEEEERIMTGVDTSHRPSKPVHLS
jgi:transcriptional regulator with XRE-family HTH domain